MIIHMAEGATSEQTSRVVERIQRDYGLRCETIVSETTVIGVKGIASVIDEDRISELPGVDRVIRITEKYKDASRSFHHDDTTSTTQELPRQPRHFFISVVLVVSPW